MRREELYLKDIIEACDAIESYTRNVDAAGFLANELLQSATLWHLTVIGEAVSNISNGIRAKYPDIPWAKIKGLRNEVSHNYAGIDLGLIWSVATIDVPFLRANIAAIIREEFPVSQFPPE